jgi:hypothetical protein
MHKYQLYKTEQKLFSTTQKKNWYHGKNRGEMVFFKKYANFHGQKIKFLKNLNFP